MRMNGRLRRLERAAGVGRDDGCPACRDRRGYIVLVTARRQPDDTVAYPEGEPTPCEQCGVVPEQVIAIVETVVETREDLARLEEAERSSLTQPNPPHRGAELP
jgi:hypothetical protein